MRSKNGEFNNLTQLIIMNILLLTGEENSGKTTTLELLYKNHFKIINPIEFSIEGAEKKDFSTVFNHNGKTIAIYTIGDEAQYIRNAFEKYSSFRIDGIEIKIDILILAHRTKIQLPKEIPIASKLPEYPNKYNVVDYPNIELITKVVKKASSVTDVNNKSNNDDAKKIYKITTEILNLTFDKFYENN